MKKINPLTLFVFLILIMLVIGPLVIPLPPLTGIKPVEELLYPDSEFVEINGLDVHFQQRENQNRTLIILLHGFGSSTYSWQKVMDSMVEFGSVLAYDRPAFGLTERIKSVDDPSTNPYLFDNQPKFVMKFIENKRPEKTILVGNSAGGTVALQTALTYPDKIDALILVSPAVYGGGGAPKWIKPFLNLPHFDRLGPIFVRSIREQGLEILELAWANPQEITSQDLENYQKPLSIENWDVALWEFTKANGDNDLAKRLVDISIPVLIISGEDDKIIPLEQSIQLSEEIPGTRMEIIPNCGHVPQEECPHEFLTLVEEFFQTIE